jgi:hypothetical protein
MAYWPLFDVATSIQDFEWNPIDEDGYQNGLVFQLFPKTFIYVQCHFSDILSFLKHLPKTFGPWLLGWDGANLKSDVVCII